MRAYGGRIRKLKLAPTTDLPKCPMSRADPNSSVRDNHEGHEGKSTKTTKEETKTLYMSFFSRACATEKSCKKDAAERVLLCFYAFERQEVLRDLRELFLVFFVVRSFSVDCGPLTVDLPPANCALTTLNCSLTLVPVSTDT